MRAKPVAIGVAAVGVALAFVVMLFGTWRVAGLILAIQTATEPPPIVAETAATDAALVMWAEEPVLPATVSADTVAAAYAGAWDAWANALSSGVADDLDRSFSGAALQAVVAGIAADGTLRQAATGHRLTLDFVHPDGWLIVFTDRGALVERTWLDESMSLREDYQVLMVQDEGRWVIRQMVRTTAEGA